MFLLVFWRSHAVRTIVYLDDGLNSARHFASCRVAATFIKSSLLSSGFLSNESKSIWQPTPCLVWLGFSIDLSSRSISIPPERISSSEHVMHSIGAQYPFSTARKLARFVGKITSMGFCVWEHHPCYDQILPFCYFAQLY